MKIKKISEELRMKNFSDMENWSAKEEKKYTGTKNVDLKLGYKVIELLEEYGLGIITVGPGDWMNRQHLLLPDETNLREYRVHIGKKIQWEDFLDDNNYDDYDNLSDEEQEKIDSEFKALEIDDDPQVEFSVFLTPRAEELEAAAFSDASTYLKMLFASDLKDVTTGRAEYNIFFDDVHGFKKFLNFKQIKISNKNLEDLPSISHRLYKDSKVFNNFEELLGNEYKVQEFLNDWLKLIK